MDLTAGGESAAAIMRAMVEIGKALKLDITAEGVETEELFEIVRQVGCTEVQGYLIGKPMPRVMPSAVSSAAKRPKMKAPAAVVPAQSVVVFAWAGES